MEMKRNELQFTIRVMAYPSDAPSIKTFVKQNGPTKAPKVPLIEKGYTIFGQIIEVKLGEKK